jgi:hypothetical protein
VEPTPEPTGPQVGKIILIEFVKWLKNWFKW